ncbi:MAG: N-6 DNA methylase [Anaerolineae bacterium]
MNASQPSLTTARHYNRGLFSDYYLDQIVPTLPEWVDDNGLFAHARDLRDDLRTLVAALRPESLDESQLEEQWVKPVLEKLGHHWSVQVKIRYREGGYRKPDYVFTATAAEARAFTNEIYEPQHIAHALALGDAKKWGAPLDQASGKERNPSQQIDEYLRYSELAWGILTDGRVWRLYHRDSSKDNTYDAVDLVELLQTDDLHDFYYFRLFFRQQAFAKAGWLEQVLQGSVDYAENLSDRLEEEVYDALELIAEGFLRYRRNRLQPDAATLHEIYEQSLVLLYRLLFVLYAESRNVLPYNDNPEYRDGISLGAHKKEIAEHRDFRPTRLEREVDDGGIYAHLSSLFFIIDVGSPEYDISPYNGHLFADEAHPFLAKKVVGGAYMSEAIDKLTRVPDRNNPRRRVFVDYRDLDVRHLGAIYEKLLEYQLEIATVPLTVRGGKYEPAKDGDDVIKKPGEVYLRGGNNERKVTGSYYTPDYIVRFIVERTLEPLLTEITTQYAALDAEGHWQVRDAAALRGAILSLNILDPATGSGHFMVEAVAYLAEWLRGLGLHPADMDEDEDELVYWKRQVVTACIYGVDVNPLAVELAKLSLWLTTIQRGKPLSFLDHHVKVGNTLVGARLNEIQREWTEKQSTYGQLNLFADNGLIQQVGAAVARMAAIENATITTVSQVKDQEHTYAELRETLAALRQFADQWTARHFGPTFVDSAWSKLFDLASRGAKGTAPELEKLASDFHFFHWELEFPEVFFTPAGQALPDGGFDAVVGNPPYVRQQSISPYKPYLAANYEIFHNNADLFLYFYERALKLVRPSRRIGYITSGTFMNSSSAANFRKYIHENVGFDTVVNFGENQPFKGAEMVYPTMAIIKKDKPQNTFRSLFVEDVYSRQELGEAVKSLPMVDTLSDVTGLDEWRFQSIELTNLFRKVTDSYTSLTDSVNGNLFYGVLTGLNAAFIINESVRQQLINEHISSAEIIQPVLRGQDLRPWYQLENNLHLIVARQGIDIEKYPAVKRHLEQFRDHLEVKPSNWDDKTQGKWLGRTSGNYTWCEWHDTVAYYQEFEKSKIVWPDISKLPRFSLNDGSYIANTGFIVGSSSQSLLALLQSRVLWFAVSQIAVALRLRAGLWQYRLILQFVQRLPIPALTAAQEAGLAALAEDITGLARGRYQLHEGMRKRIAADLGADAGSKLNEKLQSWWELDFVGFRAEVKKAFKRDIALSERDDWERYLADQQAKHTAATHDIIQREIRLNAIVYDAFHLTADEIALIEQATKYPYGAV